MGRFIGQTDNKYGNEHSRNEEGSHKTLFLGTLQIRFTLSRKYARGIHFIRFAKVGKIKGGMTAWGKNKQNGFTEKAKKWVHACGRKVGPCMW